MANNFYGAILLTGGGTGALDAIPIADLADLDAAFVQIDGKAYLYSFDASATDAESSPAFIRPDDFASAGVWVLQSFQAKRLLLPQINDPTIPEFAFGDGDTGFYEILANQIAISLQGVFRARFTATSFVSATGDGFSLLLASGSTSTIPAYMFNGDLDTGIGLAAADQLSLIAGGVEGIRITEAAGAVITSIIGGLSIALDADGSIVIDGSTNPRTVDTGSMRFEQKPSIENTRAITINLDIDSQADSHAQVINLIATALAPGETATGYDINVDRSTSTGGIIRGYEMAIAGVGSAIGHALHANPGIVPISQFSGTFINVEQAWDENGGFTDVTAAFNATGTDVTLFDTDGDMVHIGMDAAFSEIEVNLDTFAGGAGIKPVFEYSSGGGTPVWTVFTPSDNTQGFRQNGVIEWDTADLTSPTWAAATINSVSKFYIRITRTQGSIPTDPIEDTIQVASTTAFGWDENGDLIVNSISGDLSNGTGYEGTAVVSTGEGGGTKFLREDGDNTCSWQEVGGASLSSIATTLALSVELVCKYASVTTTDIDALRLILFDSSDQGKIFDNVNLTLDITNSGANGLDTGSEASDTPYTLWVVGKADGTIAGIYSESTTSPTMPSGYTFKGRIGFARNNSSSNLVEFLQLGSHHSLTQTSVLTNGAETNYTNVDISNFCPTWAKTVSLQYVINTTSGTITGAVSISDTGSGTTPGLNSQTRQIPGLSTVTDRGPMQPLVMSVPQTFAYRVTGTNVQVSLNALGFSL